MVGGSPFERSRPFNFQSFLDSQFSTPKTPSAMEEKARVSGEVPRAEPTGSILPTVNPAAEKSEPPKPALHPAFYVM